MKVAVFPCFSTSDPRSCGAIHAAARKYKRLVRVDFTRGLVRLQQEHAAEWYASPAEIFRFPVERTRHLGAL